MSRGPGRLERHIAEKIAQDLDSNSRSCAPALLITSGQIAMTAFRPPITHETWHWKPSRAQTQSVTRAMRSFVRKHQQFALAGGKGRGSLIIYIPDDLRSATRLRLWLKQGFTPLIDVDAALCGDT